MLEETAQPHEVMSFDPTRDQKEQSDKRGGEHHRQAPIGHPFGANGYVQERQWGHTNPGGYDESEQGHLGQSRTIADDVERYGGNESRDQDGGRQQTVRTLPAKVDVATDHAFDEFA